MIVYQKICATNDYYGNPRRGWMIWDLKDPATRYWAEEGYEGQRALERQLKELKSNPAKACDLGSIDVTVASYKALRRD